MVRANPPRTPTAYGPAGITPRSQPRPVSVAFVSARGEPGNEASYTRQSYKITPHMQLCTSLGITLRRD